MSNLNAEEGTLNPEEGNMDAEEGKLNAEEENNRWQSMTLEELELEYSPSRWSKRHSADAIIGAHVEAATKYSQEAHRDVPVRLDVVYGDKPRMKLDIFGEDLPKESSILVWVHGGYWQELHKDLSAYLVKPLYDQGVLTIVMGYDLAPQASVEEIVEEILTGLSWVCETAMSRGSKGVVLAGWSAGGQLVTQALSCWPTAGRMSKFSSIKIPALDDVRQLFQGVVPVSGVFDMRPLVKTYVNQPLKLTIDSAWELSPLKCTSQLREKWPQLQLLVAVGQHDSNEFQRQSKQYNQVCSESGLKSSLLIVPGADHFSIVEDLAVKENVLTTKLTAFIKTSATSTS